MRNALHRAAAALLLLPLFLLFGEAAPLDALAARLRLKPSEPAPTPIPA